MFSAGHFPFGRIENLDSIRFQLGDVALGCRVKPHPNVHCGSDGDGLVRCKQQGRGEIVRYSGGHFCEDIRGRGTDEHEVGRARELNMSDLDFVLEVPERRMDLALGERGKTHCRDELLAALGEYRGYVVAALPDEPDEFERLISGDSSADDEKHSCHQPNVARTAQVRR